MNHSLSVENFNFIVSKPSEPGGLGQVWRRPVYCPYGTRHQCGMNSNQALLWNYRNLSLSCLRERLKERSSKVYSTDGQYRGGAPRSSGETDVMSVEQRGCAIQQKDAYQLQMEDE